ncbi:MAG TPA: UvrD-helicase domain-containing protein, partial [Clostridiaceae bacterium]|nr:UvrD-helicase domain-containing protein [Clostridiaceae bacterium]
LKKHFDRVAELETQVENETTEGSTVQKETATAPSFRPEVFADFIYYFYNGNIETCTKDLIAFYSRLRSLPNYHSWAMDQLQKTRSMAADMLNSGIGDFFFTRIKVIAARYSERRKEIGDLIANPAAGLIKDKKKVVERMAQVGDVVHVLDQVVALILHDDSNRSHDYQPVWCQIRRLANSLPALPPLRVNKNDTDEKRRLIYLLRSCVGELIYQLTGQCSSKGFTDHYIYPKMPSLFLIDFKREEERVGDMLPLLNCFVALVLEVDERFARRRFNAGLLDFSDMEQLALCLVEKPEVKEYYQTLFQEIYVDEFQDTSGIQMAILNVLQQDNLFAVGDIKQSIYRFRYAKPELFMNLAATYQDAKSPHQYFELHQNFRSHPDILRGVNQVFSQLMHGGEGTEIRYGKEHAFEVSESADHESTGQPRLTVVLDELAETDQMEVIVTQKVLELLAAGHPPRDICVLMDRNDGVQSVKKALTGCGIPCQTKDSRFATNYYEQRLFIAAVDVLDNPLQDYPLLTVMTSDLPGCGFSENELALIKMLVEDCDLEMGTNDLARALTSYRYFWSDVLYIQFQGHLFEQKTYQRFASEEEVAQLVQHIHTFYETISHMRRRLDRETCCDVLTDLFVNSGFADGLLAQTEGVQRLARLKDMMSVVREYEQSLEPTVRGLANLFKLFAKQIALSGSDEFDVENRPNAVFVMTDHGSKGLEFPIIVMGDMKINSNPSRDRIKVSETYGVSANKYYNQAFGIKYEEDLLQTYVIKEEERLADFAERLRLFYVGMTRAEDELYLCFNAKNWDEQKETVVERLRELNCVKVTGTIDEFVGTSIPRLHEWEVVSLKNASQLAAAALYSAGEFDLAGIYSEAGGSQHTDVALVDLPVPIERQVTTGKNYWRIERYWSEAGPVFVEGPLSLRDRDGVSVWLESETAEGNDISLNNESKKEKTDLIPSHILDTEQTVKGADAATVDGLIRECLAKFNSLPSPPEATDPDTDTHSQVPLKLTVSELKRQSQIAAEDMLEIGGGSVAAVEGSNLYRNVNLTLDSIADLRQKNPEKLSGTALGTALHTCLEFLDLEILYATETDPLTVEKGIKRQIQMMVQGGQLKEENWQEVERFVPCLAAFATSDLARRAVRSAQRVQQNGQSANDLELSEPTQTFFGVFREIPFTLTIPAVDLYPDAKVEADERMLIQGIIDFWFDEEDRAVLVDFKSDFLLGSDDEVAAELERRYRLQLDAYGEAIRRATGHQKVEQWIWSVRRSKAYAIGGS